MTRTEFIEGLRRVNLASKAAPYVEPGAFQDLVDVILDAILPLLNDVNTGKAGGFVKGDRVRWTGSHKYGRMGTVACTPRVHGDRVKVVWDGLQSPIYSVVTSLVLVEEA